MSEVSGDDDAVPRAAQRSRERVLDPVDRISEVLFGLIMAVTIVGSLSIATAGKEDVRVAMLAALGCNLAWGLVDAVMYVVRTATERVRTRTLARRIAHANAAEAHQILRAVLPDSVVAITGPVELEAMRQRIVAANGHTRPLLKSRDYLEALAVFLLVVLATFPVVIPFLLVDNVATSMHVSQATTLVMLLLAGHALARYAGYGYPLRVGGAMAVFGAVLIAAVKALGG